MGKSDGLIWSIIFVTLAIGGLVYSQLPESMAVHFGPEGGPDGYQSKGSFFLLFGALLIGIDMMLKFTPYIDPKKENYQRFGKACSIVRVSITLLLAFVFGVVVAFNLGYTINISMVTLLMIGLLLIVTGNYMPQIKPNWFVGIKTPWTLFNSEVWVKTHRKGGPLWLISGLLLIAGAFLP